MLQLQKSILQERQFEANIGVMERNAFGELVRSTRERKRLKSYELASLMGKQPSFLSRIETGAMKETPAPDVLRALHEHLGLGELEMLRALGYLGTLKDDGRHAAITDRQAEEIAGLVREIDWANFPGMREGLYKLVMSIADETFRIAASVMDESLASSVDK